MYLSYNIELSSFKLHSQESSRAQDWLGLNPPLSSLKFKEKYICNSQL